MSLSYGLSKSDCEATTFALVVEASASGPEQSLSFSLFIAKFFSAAAPPAPLLPLPATATSDGTAPRIYAAHVPVRL